MYVLNVKFNKVHTVANNISGLPSWMNYGKKETVWQLLLFTYMYQTALFMFYFEIYGFLFQYLVVYFVQP